MNIKFETAKQGCNVSRDGIAIGTIRLRHNGRYRINIQGMTMLAVDIPTAKQRVIEYCGVEGNSKTRSTDSTSTSRGHCRERRESMNITIINEDGVDTRTDNVELACAASHIAARDDRAHEAVVLLAYTAIGELARDPIAWKWNDPIEDARFLFDESEVSEIIAEDPRLVTRVTVEWR